MLAQKLTVQKEEIKKKAEALKELKTEIDRCKAEQKNLKNAQSFAKSALDEYGALENEYNQIYIAFFNEREKVKMHRAKQTLNRRKTLLKKHRKKPIKQGILRLHLSQDLMKLPLM